MKPKISMIALGVADLARSLAFYRGLGLQAQDYKEGEDHAMFAMEGAWLFLYPRAALAEDAGVSAEGSGFTGVTLAHNAASKSAVDAVFAEALAAGGREIKRPQDVFWGGYSGYFADPDGHLPGKSPSTRSPTSPEAAASGHQPLGAGGLAAHVFRAAEQLAVEPDALEPVVQAKAVGEADAAMDLGGGAGDKAADFAQVGLGVGGGERRLGGKGVERVSGVPHQRAAGFEFGRHLGQQMLDRLKRADQPAELLTFNLA